MSIPLVVGLGSRERGDDAVGLLVADAVAGRRADVDVRCLTDPLALVDLLDGRDLAIVVDAAVTGSPVGTVRTFDATHSPLPDERRNGPTSSHGLSPTDAIELARALGQVPGRLVVVAVEVDSVELGAAPQPVVLAAVAEATTRVIGLVDDEPGRG